MDLLMDELRGTGVGTGGPATPGNANRRQFRIRNYGMMDT